MIIDTEISKGYQHFELEIEETRLVDRKGRHGGRVDVDRRSGLPYIILETFGYIDPKEYEPMTDIQKALQIFRSCEHRVDLTPDEAERLGESLIQMAADCRKYPDRRHVKD